MIKVAGIVHDSVTDGPGLRFVVFVQGCLHKCKGCHNVSTWDINCGEEWTSDRLLDELDKNPLTKGVTISGGEPFLQSSALLDFAKGVKERGMELAIYSGFTFEELCMDEKKLELLKLCDVLVDGRFEIGKKSLDLKFRGSSNQRVIDVKKSLAENKVFVVSDERWM